VLRLSPIPLKILGRLTLARVELVTISSLIGYSCFSLVLGLISLLKSTLRILSLNSSLSLGILIYSLDERSSSSLVGGSGA
jgi:hypothetical protein